MDEFRTILKDDKMNVISSTVRYVKANDETYMAYSPKKDSFAIIQMSNVGLSKPAQDKAEKTTQKLVDAAIKYGGTYYLTYQPYATREQMKKAYPNTDLFFQKKLQYDPTELFMSEFYKKYGK
jgi:decaprenylphospho-beta-D-ribofuranose 2-oxidase